MKTDRQRAKICLQGHIKLKIDKVDIPIVEKYDEIVDAMLEYASQRESKYKELYEAMKKLDKNIFMQCQLCPPKTHTQELESTMFKLGEEELRQRVAEIEKELGL
jgi:argonaute-like protein implicated in RNA metabolism and viral defense